MRPVARVGISFAAKTRVSVNFLHLVSVNVARLAASPTKCNLGHKWVN